MSPTAAADVSVSSLLDVVRDLEPLIRKHAPDAEQNRRLSTPVVEAMRDAGLFRVWIPQSLGGLEIDLVSAFRVFEAVARIDSSTGWCLANSAAPTVFGVWFSDEGAAEIFGDPNTILGGTLFPLAKAVPVDGATA